MLVAPFLFHGMNFTAGLCAVNKRDAFRLLIAFLDMARKCTALVVGPTFLGVLGFKRSAYNLEYTRSVV